MGKTAQILFPIALPSLTYKVPEHLNDIKAGDVVLAPLQGKHIYGVVESVDENTQEKSKFSLREILTKDARHLTPSQMDFIRAVAKYYLSSDGEILKLLFSAEKELEARKEQINGITAAEPFSKLDFSTILDKLSRAKRQKEVVERYVTLCFEYPEVQQAEEDSSISWPIIDKALIDNGDTNIKNAIAQCIAKGVLCKAKMVDCSVRVKHSLHLPKLSDNENDTLNRLAVQQQGVQLLNGYFTERIVLHFIASAIEREQRVVIIAPDKLSANNIYLQLNHFIHTSLMFFDMTESRKLSPEESISLRDHSPLVVVSTCRILFCPITPFDIVIVAHEESPLHKRQEPSPRYNGRDIAIMYGSINRAKVILQSVAPSFESLYNCAQKKFEHIKHFSTISCEPQILLVENQEAIASIIRKTLDSNKKALLLYRPQDRLEAEDFIFSHFNDKLPMVESIRSGFYKIDYSLHSIIFFNADSLLQTNDFRAYEKAMQAYCNYLPYCREIIVHTKDSKNSFYDALCRYFPKEYRQSLVSERKTFGYPPFSRMVAIKFSDIVDSRVSDAAREFLETISIDGVKSIGPYISHKGFSSRLFFNLEMLFLFKRNKDLHSKKLLLLGLFNKFMKEHTYLKATIDTDPL